MAVRDGIDAHFMWGIRSVRTAKTTAKADGASLMKEPHCFLLNNSVNMTTSSWKPCG